jgi:hypothetical protein
LRNSETGNRAENSRSRNFFEKKNKFQLFSKKKLILGNKCATFLKLA